MMDPAYLAECCELSYTLQADFCVDDVEVSRFRKETAGGEIFTIFAFRGTTLDGKDILRDMQGYPWWCKELGCFVHRGWLKNFRAIWYGKGKSRPAGLREYIRREIGLGHRIVLTGHSKGSGAATLIAAAMTKIGWPVAQLVSFGSPRVGFKGLAKWLDGVPRFRFVNGADIVPHLPPALLIFLRFRHIVHPINIGPSVWKWADESRAKAYVEALDNLIPDELEEHKIRKYIESLKARSD